MGELTVSPASIRDVPAIRSVARDGWRAGYEDIIGADAVEEMIDDWYDHGDLRSNVDDERSVFLVAGERATGFAHASPVSTDSWRVGSGDDWELHRICVRSRHWREGVGTALVEAVDAELRERNVEEYELTVLADNDAGVAFFESCGFERTGTESGELGGVAVEEYRYRKEL